MSKITLEVPYAWDWLLYQHLQKCIIKDWEESLFMASRYPSDDVYYADRIDQTADIMLQLINQNAY